MRINPITDREAKAKAQAKAKAKDVGVRGNYIRIIRFDGRCALALLRFYTYNMHSKHSVNIQSMMRSNATRRSEEVKRMSDVCGGEQSAGRNGHLTLKCTRITLDLIT